MGPAVLDIIDPNQFGAIPKSSTTQVLISMVHDWAKATDGNGSAVKIVLLEYKKAFDLIDHRILVDTILSLNIPRGVASWVSIFYLIDASVSSCLVIVSLSGVLCPLTFPKALSSVLGFSC